MVEFGSVRNSVTFGSRFSLGPKSENVRKSTTNFDVFQPWIDDLAQKKAPPGGGSLVSLCQISAQSVNPVRNLSSAALILEVQYQRANTVGLDQLICPGPTAMDRLLQILAWNQ